MSNNGGPALERHLAQMIAFAALDSVDEVLESTGSLYVPISLLCSDVRSIPSLLLPLVLTALKGATIDFVDEREKLGKDSFSLGQG